MSEFDIEFLSQKLSENPQSPLFARLADLLLQTEQHSEALKLCEEGIRQFPKYYAGYLVLGKVCLALKEYSTARDAFEQALDLSPFNELTAKLLASVPAQSDESVRTSDETYFEPQPPAESVSVQEQIAQQFAQQSAQQSTHVEAPTVEEIDFSHTVEEPPAMKPTAMQEIPEDQHPPPARQPETQWEKENREILSAASAPKFPSFDEFYTQHSSHTQSGSVNTLDEYLAGDPSSPATQEETPAPYADAPKEFSESQSSAQSVQEQIAQQFAQQSTHATMPTIEKTELSYADEQHEEPEPVFTSPEQAQLFAEMTGETNIEEEQQPVTAPKTTIDDLAEKLQKVERIVPQEQYQPPIVEETQEDQSAETEMVTPTLAEIYASQGEFGAAIQAYEILMFSHPGKTAEYQQRIRELQKKQMEKDGLM